MPPFRLVLAALPLLAGCAENPAGPAGRAAQHGSGDAAVAGLEQVVEVQTAAEGGRGLFGITSTLRNTGAEPVTLKVRSCYLHTSDVRGETAGLAMYEPLMLCVSAAHEITLAPGQTSEPLTIAGEGTLGRSHLVEVRHALDPQLWQPVTVRFP